MESECELREDRVGMGLFVREDMTVGGMIDEYNGERTTAEKSSRRLKERELDALQNEYHLTIHGGGTKVIDGMYTLSYTCYENHS